MGLDGADGDQGKQDCRDEEENEFGDGEIGVGGVNEFVDDSEEAVNDNDQERPGRHGGREDGIRVCVGDVECRIAFGENRVVVLRVAGEGIFGGEGCLDFAVGFVEAGVNPVVGKGSEKDKVAVEE